MEQAVNRLQDKLRRRQVAGSFKCALETAALFGIVVRASKWKNASELALAVKEKSVLLAQAQPIELAVSNIANRVLGLIREEDASLQAEWSYRRDNGPADADAFRDALKNNVLDAIKDMTDEIENAAGNIASQALEHIHSNEIIMTIGKSPAVERFLKEAAKLRKFQVIVAETSPSFAGHEMALSLSQSCIDTTLISDSAIFALMSRVNKVIIGTHVVFNNGACVAVAGSRLVAAAAKHHSTPVVVLCELYKCCVEYPYNGDEFLEFQNADAVVGFEDGSMIEKIDVINPRFDFVHPDLVSLFITNIGAHPPSYISRLMYEDSQQQY